MHGPARPPLTPALSQGEREQHENRGGIATYPNYGKRQSAYAATYFRPACMLAFAAITIHPGG